MPSISVYHFLGYTRLFRNILSKYILMHFLPIIARLRLQKRRPSERRGARLAINRETNRLEAEGIGQRP